MEGQQVVAEALLGLVLKVVYLLEMLYRHCEYLWLLGEGPCQLDFVKGAVDLHLLHVVRLEVLQLGIRDLRVVPYEQKHSEGERRRVRTQVIGRAQEEKKGRQLHDILHHFPTSEGLYVLWRQ